MTIALYGCSTRELKRNPGGEKVLADQRRGLIAKIHVAKSQMGLRDENYEALLSSFKVKSTADMTIRQLENFVRLLKAHGWKELKSRKAKLEDAQLTALRDRVREETVNLVNGEARLPGLVKRICGVDRLEWCRTVEKLERLLAVLGKLQKIENQ